MQHDLIHIQGKAYVLIPLHEYRGMTSVSTPAASDLPDDILARLLLGNESPVKILRKYRGLTQVELADKSGLSRPYLAEIETKRKKGSVTALKNLAVALNVPIGTII